MISKEFHLSSFTYCIPSKFKYFTFQLYRKDIMKQGNTVQYSTESYRIECTMTMNAKDLNGLGR